MKLIISAVVFVLLCGCAPMRDSTARNAVESSGMHDVRLGGMAFFGCDEKDFFRKKFTATNANGKPVSGVVCGGFLKGATVRFD